MVQSLVSFLAMSLGYGLIVFAVAEIFTGEAVSRFVKKGKFTLSGYAVKYHRSTDPLWYWGNVLAKLLPAIVLLYWVMG